MSKEMQNEKPSGLLGKRERLFDRLRELDSLLIAFSGGADSAYLAWAAHQTLGERALSVTALSPSFSAFDREQAEGFARHVGLRHESIATHEFENPRYVANNADRCYHCKTELFVEMEALASARNFAALAYGVNTDDMQDFRPGHRAAREHQVLAPLLEAGLNKAEIRELSRQEGLPTWDRPASACLSSRLPYGTPVTVQNLNQVERGEAILRAHLAASVGGVAHRADHDQSCSRSGGFGAGGFLEGLSHARQLPLSPRRLCHLDDQCHAQPPH